MLVSSWLVPTGRGLYERLWKASRDPTPSGDTTVVPSLYIDDTRRVVLWNRVLAAHGDRLLSKDSLVPRIPSLSWNVKLLLLSSLVCWSSGGFVASAFRPSSASTNPSQVDQLSQLHLSHVNIYLRQVFWNQLPLWHPPVELIMVVNTDKPRNTAEATVQITWIMFKPFHWSSDMSQRQQRSQLSEKFMLAEQLAGRSAQVWFAFRQVTPIYQEKKGTCLNETAEWRFYDWRFATFSPLFDHVMMTMLFTLVRSCNDDFRCYDATVSGCRLCQAVESKSSKVWALLRKCSLEQKKFSHMELGHYGKCEMRVRATICVPFLPTFSSTLTPNMSSDLFRGCTCHRLLLRVLKG